MSVTENKKTVTVFAVDTHLCANSFLGWLNTKLFHTTETSPLRVPSKMFPRMCGYRVTTSFWYNLVCQPENKVNMPYSATIGSLPIGSCLMCAQAQWRRITTLFRLTAKSGDVALLVRPETVCYFGLNWLCYGSCTVWQAQSTRRNVCVITLSKIAWIGMKSRW